MKNKFIVISGAVILGIFISISMINLPFANSENEYYSSDSIKNIAYVDGKLNITTSDDIKSICVKQTKSTPSINSLCWKDIVDNKLLVSIYEYETYYIWLKNESNEISYYSRYNAKNN